MSTRPMHARYDAVIVGARCAGAATAMLLARSGARVLVVDRQEYGSDRLSTHAIMRGGVLKLSQWGVLPALLREGTPLIRQTTFVYDGQPVVVEIKPENGVDGLIAPRRTVLDRILVDAARESGAEIIHGATLTGLLRDNDRVTGVEISGADGEKWSIAADMTVGADGRQSTVARLTQAPVYLTGKESAASVFGYFGGIPDQGTQWYFTRGATAGAIPTNNGEHCVFASVPAAAFAETFRADQEAGFMAVLWRNSPALAETVSRAQRPERLRAYAGVPGYFRRPFGKGWALVGDAGYFKDPATAHGITDALRDAELLARAIQSGSMAALAVYQMERDALSRDLFAATERIASCQWDMEELQRLHQDLSAAMKAECAAMEMPAPKLAA